MPRTEIAVNAALKTVDTNAICAAMETLVRRSADISRLAKDAGIERSILYRTFRGKKGPTLATVIKILRSAGFRFVVKFKRQPRKGRPNRFGQSSKTKDHLELRSNSKACAEYLTHAFGNDEITEIVKALENALRAQENVVEFAKRASMDRQTLYRAFRQPHVPQFSTVIHFLHALGLHLAVVAMTKNGADENPVHPNRVEHIDPAV